MNATEYLESTEPTMNTLAQDLLDKYREGVKDLARTIIASTGDINGVEILIRAANFDIRMARPIAEAIVAHYAPPF